MKLFRRISALVLTLAVVAMFGISASAASFQRHVPGENDTGAYVYGNLLPQSASASINVYGTENPGNYLRVEFNYVYFNSDNELPVADIQIGESYDTAYCAASLSIGPEYHFTGISCRYHATYGVYNGGPYTLSCGPYGLTLP